MDEWAELPAEAREYADSIARRGRAVAENLIAATQRPDQDAMGKGTAVRSQMDIRICLRVQEPRDADLILGQGMVNSGWHAHKLTKPGEFLISDDRAPASDVDRYVGPALRQLSTRMGGTRAVPRSHQEVSRKP